MIVKFRTMESPKVCQNDLQATGIALANNLILVTHNTREFERVQGLQLEDWEVAV